MSREVFCVSRLVNGMVLLALFAGVAILRVHPAWLDYPVSNAVSVVASGHGAIDWLPAGLAYPAVEGVAVLSLFWYCWFSGIGPEAQARLANGVVWSVVAGLFAHLLQQTFPSTPKPVFDPFLRFAGTFDHFDVAGGNLPPAGFSFPSERATLFAALVTVILLSNRSRPGLFALGFFMAAEFSRIYLGLHFLTDIIGSYFLGAAIVWIGDLALNTRLTAAIFKWRNASASTFYMFAFFASYQLADAFSDVRTLIFVALH